MAAQKPWLCALVLEKLGRHLAAASRTAQKQVVQAAGKHAFCDIFAESDKLMILIKDAVIQLQMPNAEQPHESPSDAQKRWPTSAEALGEERQNSCDDSWIEALADDRLAFIRPVIVHDMKRSLGQNDVAPHLMKVLRRNVAAHARGATAALKVSELNPGELTAAQKVA